MPFSSIIMTSSTIVAQRVQVTTFLPSFVMTSLSPNSIASSGAGAPGKEKNKLKCKMFYCFCVRLPSTRSVKVLPNRATKSNDSQRIILLFH